MPPSTRDDAGTRPRARWSISRAARRVNVSSRMRSDGTPAQTSHATRAHSVVVLPVPGAGEDQQRPARVRGGRPLLVVELVEPRSLIGLRQNRHTATARYGARRTAQLTSRGCLTGYRIVGWTRPTSARCGPTPLATAARILDAARSAFAEAGLDVGRRGDRAPRRRRQGHAVSPLPDQGGARPRDLRRHPRRHRAHRRGRARPSRTPGTAFAAYLAATARMQASNQGFYDVVAQRLGAAALTDGAARARPRRDDAAARARAGRPASSATTSCPRTCS